MKRVALDSSYADAKTKSRLQNLMQDYQELQKEVESSRNKLENMNQRKRTLRAEVRFLRQRYKHLIERKAMTQERGKEIMQQHNVDDQRKKIVKVRIPNKKEVALRPMPPVFKPNNKVKVYSGNEISQQNVIPSSDLKHKGKHHSASTASRFNPTTSKSNSRGRMYKGKEVARETPVMMIDLNKQEDAYNGIGLAAFTHTPASVLDLSRNEAAFSGNQLRDQSEAPIFDLNQRLVEDEDNQDSCEMARQDKLSDLKLSLCRNVGEGTNRVVKRKISWQDPVALRV